ncbi:MAG: hypothetical protein AB8G11_20680 [Saprospiraceae bacterium]
MPKPIENSEKFITDGVSGGKVAFRDLFESIVLNINGSIKDDPYYGKFERGNPIYDYFISIDRKNIIDELRDHFSQINCGHTNCPIIAFKTAAEHQPDWLFDRFYSDLVERNNDDFNPITYNLIDEIKIKEIHRIFKYQSGKEYIKNLSDNKYHLIHIKVDIDNEDSKLHQFISDFCHYWKEKPENIKCLIFLSVKLRAFKKRTFFQRMWPKKKQHHLPNMHLIEELEWVQKTDIDRFFENHFNCFPSISKTKTQYSIQESWKLFAIEIDKIIAARKSKQN